MQSTPFFSSTTDYHPCGSTKRDGDPCTRPVANNGLVAVCYFHDPHSDWYVKHNWEVQPVVNTAGEVRNVRVRGRSTGWRKNQNVEAEPIRPRESAPLLKEPCPKCKGRVAIDEDDVHCFRCGERWARPPR